MPRIFFTSGKVLSLLLLIQIPLSPVFADIILLKNGERLEAKITKTTDTTVEAEVKMSSSITDVRVIQKSEIANIEKPDPADAAFETIKFAGPGPNSLNDALYDQAIGEKLQPFLIQYPASKHALEVKAMIAALQDEKKRVDAGDVKVENEWFTPVELEKQKEQIAAMLIYQQMKTLDQSGDYLGALNTFSASEKMLLGTKAYPLAVDYAVQLLPKVQQEIITKTALLKNDLAEREKGLQILPDYKKKELNAAAADEDKNVDTLIATAQAAGRKWTPIYPRNKKSIEELQKTAVAEGTRLVAIKTAPMLASIAAVADAKKALAAGDVATAKVALRKATTLWPANLMLKDANAALVLAQATPVPTPTPAPTPKATPKPKPAVKPSAAPNSASIPQPLPALTQADAKEKQPFLTTIPGALTVFGASAVIAGGISWLNKIKSKEASSGAA